jgi:hypothetical protein
MKVENFLYFAKSGTSGTLVTDSACYPVSSFLGSQPLSATTTGLYFKDSTNLAHSAGTNAGKHNLVTLTHETNSTNANIHRKIAKAVATIAANPGRGKVLTVVDTADGVVAEEFEAHNNTTAVSCTAIAITQ